MFSPSPMMLFLTSIEYSLMSSWGDISIGKLVCQFGDEENGVKK